MEITTILFSLLIISVIFGASVYALEYKTLKLIPTDDAFVVVNPDDPDDLEKFQTANTGNKEFFNVWSSYSISPEFGELNAITYLKFDLRDVDVQNMAFSELWIFPTIINIENLEEIELFYVQDNDWNESEITYLTRPLIDSEPIFTLEITPQRVWHIFDTMEIVEKNMGSEITLALNFKEKQSDQERSIEYSSNEGIDISLRPYLVIISDPSVGPTQEDRIAELEKKILELQQQNEGGGCLIATATFGSELAPQVQQLRELRDNTLLQTNSGTAFMESFNSLYYSFSPAIADLERQNPAFKETVKLAITPLVVSLSILNYLDIDSEEKMLGYGIGIILLNLGMYFVAPAIIITKLAKLKKICKLIKQDKKFS